MYDTIDPIESLPRITIPAYAFHSNGQTVTLFAMTDWHDKIRELTPFCTYGAGYCKDVIESLVKMSDHYQAGRRLEARAALTKARGEASKRRTQ